MKIISEVEKPTIWPLWYVTVRVGDHEMKGQASTEPSAESLRKRWEDILLEKAKTEEFLKGG